MRRFDVWIVLAVSALVSAAVLWYGKAIWYDDSHSYINYAFDITKGSFNPSLYWRSAGYPIILVLTGVVATGSVWGALIVQGIAAAAMPALIYLTLAPINRVTALATAGVSAASLICHQYVMTIYPDQLYMLALVALAFFLSRWLTQDGGAKYIYAIAATCFVLSWLRPIGLVLALGCLAVALWRRRGLAHVAVCAALFIGANLALHAWQRQAGEVRSMLGRQVFFNIYLHSGGVDTTSPHAAELRRFLVEFFRTEAHKHDLAQWAVSPADHQRLIGQYIGKPEEQVAAIFREPTTQYLWTMWHASNNTPPRDGDRLFLWAAIEYAGQHPGRIISFALDHYRALVLGPPWVFFGASKAMQGRFFEPMSLRPNSVSDDMSVAISKDPFLRELPRARVAVIRVAFAWCAFLTVPTTYVLMLIGVLGFARSPGVARTTAFTVFCVHLCNVAALAVLVDPQFRYQVQNIPLALIGGGIGAYRLATWLALLRAARPNVPKPHPRDSGTAP